MIKESYIYKITNDLNGKMYIGQTNDFIRRKNEHISDSRNRPEKSYIHRSMAKHGPENFTFTILEKVNSEEASEKEIKYIKKYNTYQNGYNLTTGGEMNEHKRFFTDEEIIEIRKEKNQKTFTEIYKEYGEGVISYGGMKKIVYGESYGNLPSFEDLSEGEKSKDLIKKENIEKGKGRRVYTDDEVLKIRQERPKYTLTELHDLYGKNKISLSGFEKVVNSETYKHVPSLKDVHGEFKVKLTSPKRLLNDEEVIAARKAKSREKCSRKELHKKYGKGKISFSAFNKMIYSDSYKELPSVDELKED